MYVSVLCGCIPVIFEPATRHDYDAATRTSWAWRRHPDVTARGGDAAQHFVEYFNTFAVVMPCVQEGGSAGGASCAPPAGFLEQLRNMPDAEPERFAALRAGVDAVAPLMRYATEECGEGLSCADAFSHFVEVLERNKGLLDASDASRMAFSAQMVAAALLHEHHSTVLTPSQSDGPSEGALDNSSVPEAAVEAAVITEVHYPSRPKSLGILGSNNFKGVDGEVVKGAAAQQQLQSGSPQLSLLAQSETEYERTRLAFREMGGGEQTITIDEDDDSLENRELELAEPWDANAALREDPKGPGSINTSEPRIYVLPVPSALTDDLLACYAARRGGAPWDDSRPHGGDCDTDADAPAVSPHGDTSLRKTHACVDCFYGNRCAPSLSVAVAQHAGDVWLHKGILRSNSKRTALPSRADVIFVPFYGAPARPTISPAISRAARVAPLPARFALAVLTRPRAPPPLQARSRTRSASVTASRTKSGSPCSRARCALRPCGTRSSGSKTRSLPPGRRPARGAATAPSASTRPHRRRGGSRAAGAATAAAAAALGRATATATTPRTRGTRGRPRAITSLRRGTTPRRTAAAP